MIIIEILGGHRAIDLLRAEVARRCQAPEGPQIQRDIRLVSAKQSVLRLSHDTRQEVPDKDGRTDVRTVRTVAGAIGNAFGSVYEGELITVSRTAEGDNGPRSVYSSVEQLLAGEMVEL